jgi:hypothetical protein
MMEVRVSVNGSPAATLEMPETPRIGDQIGMPGGPRIQITAVAWVKVGNQWIVALAAHPVATPFGDAAEFQP